MIRSIHVLASDEAGGTESFFVRLVEALNAAGHPALAVIHRRSPMARALSPSVEQVRLPFFSKRDAYSRWRLQRLIAAWQPDIVQTYLGTATRLTRVPPQSRAVHVARLGIYQVAAMGNRHVDAWIGNTLSICKFMRVEGIPAERVFHIGNFVPPARPVAEHETAVWRGRLRLPDGAFAVLALGRMVPKKGFEDLLRAFARVRATRPDGRPVVLLVGGDGPERTRLVSLSEQIGVVDRVRWCGWIEDPAPLYALAHALVCPSRHEPLGNVILEAWQRGLPVLATRTAGARELVSDGVDGLLAPVADWQGLAGSLDAFLALPQERLDRLGASGRDTLLREHNEQTVLAAYIDLYERLRGTSAGAGSAAA
jgi:glycosyltransferase involved in cell wall biosynthesis